MNHLSPYKKEGNTWIKNSSSNYQKYVPMIYTGTIFYQLSSLDDSYGAFVYDDDIQFLIDRQVYFIQYGPCIGSFDRPLLIESHNKYNLMQELKALYICINYFIAKENF